MLSLRSVCVLACLLLALFSGAQATRTVFKDVCILGSGAGGMSAAAFLKDLNYDVVVIEQDSVIAGHCNTRYFDVPAGQPNWKDIGVQFFPNTTYMNELGIGPYALSTDKFINRFGGGAFNLGSVFTGGGGPAPAIVDFKTGTYLGAFSSPPDPSFATALQALLREMAKYPWLDTGAIPAKIPADLLMPFNQYIAKYHLEPLVPSLFYNGVLGGGLPFGDSFPTIWALRELSPSLLAGFTLPNTLLSTLGGCDTIYQGIRNYIGAANVLTSAKTTFVYRRNSSQCCRPGCRSENPQILLGGVFTNAAGGTFSYECNSLIVAFPQLPQGMEFLDLNSREEQVFDQMERFYYYDGLVNIEGPIASKGAILNINPAKAGFTPDLPCILAMSRSSTSTPFGLIGTSNAASPFNAAQMKTFVEQSLQRLKDTSAAMNNPQITSFSVVEMLEHVYWAHPKASALKQNPSWFVQAEKLQGYRNTYYTGAAMTYAASHVIWDYTFRLVQENFGPKGNNKEDSSDSSSYVYGGVASGAAVLAGVGVLFVRRRKNAKKTEEVTEGHAEQSDHRSVSVSSAVSDEVALKNISDVYATVPPCSIQY